MRSREMAFFKRKKKDQRIDEITAWAESYREEQHSGEDLPAPAPTDEVIVEEEERGGATTEVDVQVEEVAEAFVEEPDAVDLLKEIPTVPLPEVGEILPHEEEESSLEEIHVPEVTEGGGEVLDAVEETVEEVRSEETEPEVVETSTAPSFFQKLRAGLSRTREGLVGRIDRLFSVGKKIDADTLEELEEILIESDIGVGNALALIEKIRERIGRKELKDPQIIKECIREDLTAVLAGNGYALKRPESGPCVIMVVGVNGVGKTTTIGKLAHRFTRAGDGVLLAAGDTFRAAATEQLEIWGGRVGAEVVRHQSGADPSAVVFDALKAAESRQVPVVIADTAGRLHTQVNLMEELKKMKRVMAKVVPGAPHEVLLVLDATTGQNALSQARIFHETVGVTGIVLTKLDGTAKGGIVTAITAELGIPVKLIGIGEGMEDLRDFHPEEFVSALFD